MHWFTYYRCLQERMVKFGRCPDHCPLHDVTGLFNLNLRDALLQTQRKLNSSTTNEILAA